jgi:hypothetical protein
VLETGITPFVKHLVGVEAEAATDNLLSLKVPAATPGESASTALTTPLD